MGKNPKPLGRTREGVMKLIALLLYIAEQKKKNPDTAFPPLDAAKEVSLHTNGGQSGSVGTSLCPPCICGFLYGNSRSESLPLSD